MQAPDRQASSGTGPATPQATSVRDAGLQTLVAVAVSLAVLCLVLWLATDAKTAASAALPAFGSAVGSGAWWFIARRRVRR